MFSSRVLEWKSRKSRNTWSNREIWLWSTEWSRSKVNRLLPRKGTGHSKHALPTTQDKTLHMDITGWSTLKSDWLYSLQLKMEKLYTVSKNKTRSWQWLIMNSLLPNSDLNWRPFRYDLSQIPYDYTVEVRNRFKGQDLWIPCRNARIPPQREKNHVVHPSSQDDAISATAS